MQQDESYLVDDESKHETTVYDEDDDDIVKETQMGLCSWRPGWLQTFNSVLWFLVVVSLAAFVQGIYYIDYLKYSSWYNV